MNPSTCTRKPTRSPWWCKTNNVPEGHFSENVIAAFMEEQSKSKKPSTCWCVYSKLKATLLARHNIDIEHYSLVVTTLKAKAKDYKTKKSKAFTLGEVQSFARTA